MGNKVEKRVRLVSIDREFTKHSTFGVRINTVLNKSTSSIMKTFVVLFMLILGACTHTTPTPTLTLPPTPESRWVEFTFDDVTIELQQLPGWDVYVKTENRLIMAEGDDPFRTSGGLNGLLVNIWVPSLSNLSVNYDLEQHSIAEVLNLVLRTSALDDALAIHDPIPFEWADHEAAYYTLTNENGNLSLVMALKVSDVHFIAVNISAPNGHGNRIRETLPQIFAPFHINGKNLANEALLELPSPLVFPDLEAVSSTE